MCPTDTGAMVVRGEQKILLGVLVNHLRGSKIMSCSLQGVVLRATESSRCTVLAVSAG